MHCGPKTNSDMNKAKKTYGIKGFMEYQALIKVGKSRMKVTFTGGSMSAKGVIPCTFSTDNYMTQHAIENSKEFKNGFIYIANNIPMDGTVEIERANHVDANHANEEQPANEQGDTGNGTEAKPAEEALPSKSAESAESDTTDEGVTLTEVEFASNDEAKDYLEQNFGLARNKLRNREDIYNAGKANGVEIIFI